MITQYFDINQRLVIQAPGTLAPASVQPWVYADNYNLIIYLVGNGQFQTIGANDSLELMLFQPGATLPEQNLAIISAPTIQTDPAGFSYYLVNVNLKTTPLADLVQANNTPAKCEFHYIFTPASGERFSGSADVAVTVNPDPSQSATGATPVPPGYPTNPNVFEQIINKNIANGYAGLDPNDHLNPNQIPTDTTMAVVGGKLTVVGGGSGGGNPYVAVITASFTIPAEGANTPTLTLGAAAPDILANETVLITDGVSFIAGTIASISGTSLTVTNNGAPGAVSGTMGANAHVYLGNTAGPVDSTRRGLVQKLPINTPTKLLYRGDDSFAQANYPDLTNIPLSFSPATHGTQHISTGSDAIPLATASATGLMPARTGAAGTYLDISGNWSIPAGGGGGNPFVGTTGATFIIPAVGTTGIAITLAAAIADLVNGMGILITDGNHEVTFITTIVSGTSLTATCTGTVSSGATMANGAHVYFSIAKHGAAHAGNAIDPIPFGTNAVAGILSADGSTVIASAGQLSVPTAVQGAAGTGKLGLVQPDGTTLTLAAGILSAAITPGIAQNAEATSNTAQSLTANTLLAIIFQSALFQNGGTYWTAANPTRLTIPAGNAGVYAIGGMCAFTASATGSLRQLNLRRNGGPMIATNNTISGGSAGAWTPQGFVMALYNLAVGDYIELVVQADAAINTVAPSSGSPCLWMYRIS